MESLITIYLAINLIGMFALAEFAPPETAVGRFVCGAVIVACPLALVAMFAVCFVLKMGDEL